MCKRLLYLLVYSCIILSVNPAKAQTQIWSDNFEDGGAPSSGTRTASIEFGCNNPSTAYFKRTDASGIRLHTGDPTQVFSNVEGSKFWAAMDIDRGTACSNNSTSPGQTITWSGINIAGKNNLSFKGLFGANSAAVFQGLQFANTTNGFTMDSMAVAYRIDGGAWTKIIGIYPTDGTTFAGSPFAVDNNNDRIGDGSPLVNALAEISANIIGAGTTLDLQFSIFLNNGSPGSIAIDNFRLFENAEVLPVKWASFKVRQQDQNILLNWSTSSELNTKDFAIQHKNETGTWKTISRLPASGKSNSLVNYSYTHFSPSIGLNLYRIVQTDLDGKESISEIKSILFKKTQPSFTIMANPVTDGVLRLQVNKPVHLSLLSSEGKLIWRKQVTPGLLSVPVGNYLKGIYTLTGKNEFKKIVIQ